MLIAVYVQEDNEKEPLLQNSSSNEEIFSSPGQSNSISSEPAEEHTKAISFCGALRIPVSGDHNLLSFQALSVAEFHQMVHKYSSGKTDTGNQHNNVL